MILNIAADRECCQISRRGIGGLTLVLLVALGACGAADDPLADSGLVVVATTSILGDVVAHLVGDDGTVEVLMGPGVDPHDFSLSAQQTAFVLSADLVVVNGLGLEASMESVLEAAEADGANVLALAGQLQPLPFGGGEAEEHEHEHGSLDPHFWFDPQRMSGAVDLIVAALVAADPGSSDRLAASAAEYKNQIQDTDARVEAILEEVPLERRVLVTNHDNLGYFADRYDFTVADTVIPGGSSLAEPSPAEVAELVDFLAEQDLTTIFTDATGTDRLAQAVAAELGTSIMVQRLHTDALGEPGSEADTYLGLMESNAKIIAEALG